MVFIEKTTIAIIDEQSTLTTKRLISPNLPNQRHCVMILNTRLRSPLLIEHHASWQQRNKNGAIALYLAARYGHLATVMVLLDADAHSLPKRSFYTLHAFNGFRGVA